MFASLNAIWNSWPASIRKALRDAGTVGVATGLAAFAALSLIFPGTIDQAKAEALLVWVTVVPTVVAAVVAVLRVELFPALLNWLLGYKFATVRTAR